MAKDFLQYDCKCGAVIKSSIMKSPNIAPSFEELKMLNEAFTQEVIYHQNNQCAYMNMERSKARLATKPPQFIYDKR